MAKDIKQPKPNDKVKVVLANGSHSNATITKVHKTGVVDLILDPPVNGTEQITSSPCDPAGKRADSWFFPEEQAEAAKA